MPLRLKRERETLRGMRIQYFVKDSKARGYNSYTICIFMGHVRPAQGKEHVELE